MNTTRKFAALIGCAALASSTAWADSPPPREPGVWQKHEYSFVFMGFTSTYSCDGLADKIKLLLIAAGARPDAKSRPGACASGFGRPDKFARADLTFYTLAPGNADTPGAPHVDGIWRPVVFADHSPRELAVGDCELIEQFRHNVVPMFSTRNIEDRTTCVPNQESGSLISLRFESFAAAPRGPSAPPAPGGT
jgi:hypothetical protein